MPLDVRAAVEAASRGVQDDDLRLALRGDKDALLRVVSASWERGWNDCNEEYQRALLVAGVTIPQPVARA